MTKQTQDNLQKRYQLHSSQFINIAFGKYEKRNDMVEFVKNDSFPEPDEDGKKRMEWGVKHEADGIANWLIHCSGGKYPQYVLNEQKDFLLENVFNLDDGNIVDLSSKPDGISDDGTTIIEIKCPNEGGKLRKDLDNAKLPQVVGQQLVLRNNGFPIQKTHLCEWTPHHFRVCEILPNHNLEKHLLNELKVFTDALLYGKPITDKPKKYMGGYGDNKLLLEVKK